MAEIDAEVRRRRASGDLPAGLEAELDELFLEFSPVGLQGRARLRETLALVDGSAYVDIAVPDGVQQGGRQLRQAADPQGPRLVHELHRRPDREVRLVGVADVPRGRRPHRGPRGRRRGPPVTRTCRPTWSRRVGPGDAWWAAAAVDALAGVTDRVAGGRLRRRRPGRVAAGRRGGRLRGGPVGPGSRAGARPRASTCGPRRRSTTSTWWPTRRSAASCSPGSVQWLRPNERERLLDLVSSRLAVDGVLVLHSATPDGLGRLGSARGPGPRPGTPAARRDLGPPAGRPRVRGAGHRSRRRRPAPGPRGRRRSPTPTRSTPPSTPSTTCCSGRRSTSWSPRGSGDRRPPVRAGAPAPGRHGGPHPRPARRPAGRRMGLGHLRRGRPRRAAGRGDLLRGVPVPGPTRRRARSTSSAPRRRWPSSSSAGTSRSSSTTTT